MSASDLSPGLMLVHGNQAEALRDLLIAWMSHNPLAPLETEVVLVQSNGIAQWLRLALAADVADGGCGIAAGLDFSLPSRFLWRVYRAVLGRQRVPESSPFDEARLTWRLMRLLPAVLGDEVFLPLRRFLRDDDELRKRYQLACRLADLYDQYQVYRADWLEAWACGEDVLIDARGARQPLGEDERWQAALWRHVLADVAAGNAEGGARGGRATVHEAFLRAAADWPADARPPSGLPRRVLVFGISSLPRQSLEVLAALARWSQVLMCVHNPCEHYWADIVEGRDLLRGRASRQQPRPDRPLGADEAGLHLHAHPLLAAWGKQGRDFIALLDEHDGEAAREHQRQRFQVIGARLDHFAPTAGDSLLRQLQDDIRDLRPLAESRARWPALDPARDTSLRFHIAHGPQREVEILHDQLLAAFNADPSLRPRDVIVMVPDIDAYAPHIQAVFGLMEADDPRHIPYSVADQGTRGFDPLVHALEILLGLPRARLGVGEVLDLLEVPALRRRFGIEADDLPVLHRWMQAANIRWGLHGAHRASLALPAAGDADPHTWLFGLRRLLLGYAVGDGAAPWRGIEPEAEAGGLEAAALGPLAHLLTTLDHWWRELSDPAPPAAWQARLSRLLADFFLAEEGDDAYTLLRLESALDRWREACDDAGLDEILPLTVVAEPWLAALDEGGLSQRFLAGAVTFATLMPMRAIPFRQVCLLGMNDGDYPRTRAPLDFDLMGRDYRPGDRSRREDDRYLFLEALLSARDVLYLSWVGRSVHDNSPRPPSVLVAQLRDHLAAGWRLPDGRGGEALLAALSTEHPLQAFSPAYFPPVPGPLFTYAHEWRAPSPAVATHAPLAALEREEPLRLDELAAFLRRPVERFFQQRLAVHLEAAEAAGEDVEPFELDGLRRWQLQDEMIRAQRLAVEAGEDPQVAAEACLARFTRRGDLPAGAFGARAAAELAEPMPALFEAYRQALAEWPWAEDSEGGGVALALASPQPGLLDQLPAPRRNAAGEHAWLSLESSNLVDSHKHYRGDVLIRHWLRHLGYNLAAGPTHGLVLSKKGHMRFDPVPADDARRWLTAALAAWADGMRRPLPLAVETAFVYLRKGDLDAARACYEGNAFQPGELGSSPYLRRAWPDFDALLAGDAFPQLAETLLRPLYVAMHRDARS